MQKVLLGIVGLVIIVGLILYLSKSDTGVTDQTPVETQTVQNMPVPDAPATNERVVADTLFPPKDVIEVTLHGENYKFTPAIISVKEGQTVRVIFTSDSGLHDFGIDEIAGAKTAQLQAGKSETIEFVADKKGAFTYYCSVGNHRAMGMEGTLTVE